MQFKNSKEYLVKINQHFHYILAGPLLFFAYLFMTRSKDDWNGLLLSSNTKLTVDFIAAPILVILSILVFIKFLQSKNSIKENDSLPEKLNQFHSCFIRFQILYGILASSALICLLFTGGKWFIGIYIIQLFVTSFYNPSVQMLTKNLPLTNDEVQSLKHQKEFQ